MTWKQLKNGLGELCFWIGMTIGGLMMIPVIVLMSCVYVVFTAVDTLSLKLKGKAA